MSTLRKLDRLATHARRKRVSVASADDGMQRAMAAPDSHRPQRFDDEP